MNPMLALRQYQKVNGVAQTSVASPHRLVQMLMQGGLDRIAQAKGAMARNDIAQRGILIGKAIGIVGGLREGLDLENHGDSLAELDSLYSYMSKRLIEANVQNDPEILNEVARLLITLKEGWDGIGDQPAEL
ncbi:flagellar export chaperone FliS [Pseudomonas alkylphenolica]|uniref:Flagellar secretion chaperone FliS n=1 Tax=Pseudomonas alkylphenolica TaxID=237609 RepID=A0A077FFP8_9PSED|nr:flagellar export chaperone FliS [Pseudomonas alkylphenolica]AIL62914.1 flagellar protein FliS [Pseudomonas alkylphenolica]